MRRFRHRSAVVTLLAVTAGTLLAGIAGALIAVPACAAIYHAVIGYRGHEPDITDEPARDQEASATTVPSPADRPSESAAGDDDVR